jgi:hypothetical protein
MRRLLLGSNQNILAVYVAIMVIVSLVARWQLVGY